MSKKNTDEMIERFMKYGMDVSCLKISDEERKVEVFEVLILYLNEMMSEHDFTYDNGRHFIIYDYQEEPLMAFVTSSDYSLIMPAVPYDMVGEDVVKKILICFIAMVKDAFDWVQDYVTSDKKNHAFENNENPTTPNVLSNVGKAVISENKKKYKIKQGKGEKIV